MSPRPVRALLGLLCVTLLAGACSSETSEPSGAEPAAGQGSTPAADATTPPATDRSTPPAAPVLAFTAPRLGGGTIEGADFAGRDVAFWFWAPW
jgi:hypothetical protein